MKKVLFLSNHFITLYSFRKELLIELSKGEYDIYISTPKDSQNSFFTDLGFNVIETNIDRRGINPLNDITLIKQYYSIMKKIKPDIIFSFTVKPNIYGSFVSNILNIRQICNITGTGGTFLNNDILARLVRFLYKISVKKSYKVFFQNTGDLEYFKKYKMIANNYDVLPGSGVNLERYQITSFPNDRCISFIFIGRVMKLKGIDEYLEAAKIIKQKYKNVNFYIAGWNEEQEYIDKVHDYENKGYVKYLGFQNNIYEWIKKCQCVILPSHGGEGIPNVLLEAAATGRICIASRINGSKDVIDETITGFLFEKNDYYDLASKIEMVLSMNNVQKEIMALNARRKIEQKFDRKIVVNKYLEELQ
ncbi:glycosyltransferase family 4 protein [uncultured Thomasclavelia sp.]|uniref:glycosyltransferase family 4 protein n=1 Tax=uncultured Thomasclavelia sp. TaxID=3025759 RepID=UPI00261E493B|nr:glycosyltransferase family 4 protein [uncultured Thomasclavelia sp.]